MSTPTRLQATPPLCWICGQAPAISGEHRAKRSDLRDLHGAVSQAQPLFLNDATHKNRRVGSLDSDLMKWPKSLCHGCNTARTQAHDLAWESFSRSLQAWTPPLAPGSVVLPTQVFPVNTAASMLAVHLFCVKTLGCMAVAGNIAQIDVASLADAIMNGRAHPDVYLGICTAKKVTKGPMVSAHDGAFLDPDTGALEVAYWLYNLDGVCVQMIYMPSPAVASIMARKQGLWHPRDGIVGITVTDIAGQLPA